jgi:hypothetical protein
VQIETIGYSSSSSPITFSNSITNSGEYHSVLRVKNAFFLDTGYYYCIVDGTTDFRNSLNNVTHVYVYIKGKQKIQILHFPHLWKGKYLLRNVLYYEVQQLLRVFLG